MFEEEKPSPFAYVLGAVLVLGAIGAGYWFLHSADPSGPAPVNAAGAPVPAETEAQMLARATTYFEKWGGYAVWENETAEFALWSDHTRDYSIPIEVRRQDGRFTYRRIPRLTRPVIDHGDAATAPLEFTETAALRREYYRNHPGPAPASRAGRAPSSAPALPPRPPERFARAPAAPARGGPAYPILPAGDENARTAGLHAALVADFLAILARAGDQSAQSKAKDLVAVLVVSEIRPVPLDASPDAALAAALEQKDRVEGALVASSAFLTPNQLAIYRQVLDRYLRHLPWPRK